jgi:D-alanyl-D-alanine endopeptidase (penicillin-binding protein 7)
VKETRLNRAVGLICALTVVAGLGLPTPVAAQATTAAPRGSSTGKLALPQKAPSTTTARPAARRQTAAARTAAARARAQRLARARAARAAAAARTLREAQQPKFKLDANGLEIPDLRAAAAIVYNPATGQVLWEQNAQDQRSIASITKIMTAAVFLENNPDLSRQVVVQAVDTRRASTTYLRAGYKVTANDLLHLTLIGSDNAAARALARISPHGSAGFITRMNAKAEEMGLTATHYTDPSGLLADNVSSAFDMARLISSVGSDDRIAHIMQMPRYSMTVGTRTISVNSTNALVKEGEIDVLGGKTGFIRRAGYCLATLLRLPQGGPEVAVVVLGAQNSVTRFWETRHLFNWFAGKAQELLGGTPVQAAPATN